MVGQILDKLDQLGLTQNTLVILSSDNGGVNDDNGPDKAHGIGDPDATNGHKPTNKETKIIGRLTGFISKMKDRDQKLIMHMARKLARA